MFAARINDSAAHLGIHKLLQAAGKTPTQTIDIVILINVLGALCELSVQLTVRVFLLGFRVPFVMCRCLLGALRVFLLGFPLPFGTFGCLLGAVRVFLLGFRVPFGCTPSGNIEKRWENVTFGCAPFGPI